MEQWNNSHKEEAVSSERKPRVSNTWLSFNGPLLYSPPRVVQPSRVSSVYRKMFGVRFVAGRMPFLSPNQ